MALFDHIKNFWSDFWKTFFEHVVEIAKEVVVTIVKDFRPILLGLLALGYAWFAGGGYDAAEKAHLEAQKKAQDQAQALQELQNAKQRDPNAGVYIVK